MRKIKNLGWQFLNGYELKGKIPDPRLAVTMHTGWSRPNISSLPDCTHNAFPEPDNYTHAIWFSKPVFINNIEHQCWYRDRARGGWVSIYVVTTDEKPVFDEYIKQHAIWGLWINSFVKTPRKHITRIEAEKHIKWGDHHGFALDEVLYQQGYFDNLVYKGAELAFIESHAGKLPRDETV